MSSLSAWDEHTDYGKEFTHFRATGSEEAATRVVKGLEEDVGRVLMRNHIRESDIDDIRQEVFAKLFNRKDQYDDSKPLLPWVLTIASNYARDTLRKTKRRAHVKNFTDVQREEDRIFEVVDPFSISSVNHDAGMVALSSLNTLEPKFRNAVEEMVMFGRRSREIAEQEGVQPATIKWRSHEGVTQLREKIQRSLGKLINSTDNRSLKHPQGDPLHAVPLEHQNLQDDAPATLPFHSYTSGESPLHEAQ